MTISDRLRELATNLYWIWHPQAMDLFRALDAQLWRKVNHNPIEFLLEIPEDVLEQRAEVLVLESRISYAFHVLRHYLTDKDTWGARYAHLLKAHPVAYFSAEFGIHESLPIYSGGLGALAGDHLKAASDLGLPLVGVGLFYAKGYFRQSLDANGWQQEDYFTSDVNVLPLQRVLDDEGNALRMSVHAPAAGEIWIEAWTAHVGRCQLVLLDTNVAGNSDEVRALTSQLYGGGTTVRIRQELVLGVGGLRFLQAMHISPGVIHMNEGHSAFAALELARSLMHRDGVGFAEVEERAAAMCVFTTHTPVAAGHDRFSYEQVHETLGSLAEEIGLDSHHLMGLGRVNPDDSGETFCMTVLGMKMSRHRNAVSALHGRVTRTMWHPLWHDRAEHEVPVGHITNGVHLPTWLAPQMGSLYARYLGEDWQHHLYDPQIWQAIDQIDDEELWEQNQILKSRLVDFVRRRVRAQEEARGQISDGDRERVAGLLDKTSLTIGFARRFAQYKRGALLLRDLDRLDRLVNNPDRPVQFVFAGKAHPADDPGKQIIQEIFKITQDPRFHQRIVFVEDYDINVCRHLVQGVDLWLNTPRRPLEACGTSGQKAMLNGALNLSVLDGWWAEAYDGTNGFAVGQGAEHRDHVTQDDRDYEGVFSALENEVVPMFYGCGKDGLPREWIARQKNALRTLAWRFIAHRMLSEYTRGCYLPAVGGLTSSFTSRHGQRDLQ